MNATLAAALAPPRRAAGLYTIVVVKLGKALLLLAVALGIYSLLGNNLAREFEDLLRLLRQNPEHEFWTTLAARVEQLTPAGIKSLASGTLLYAVLLVVESLGLLWGSWWAVWLAIAETAFFIPIEMMDLFHRFRLGIALLLVVNVLIVTYLVRNRRRLFGNHQPAPVTAALH
jgi:uncharacterized membrane protein (DUF2068 family)